MLTSRPGLSEQLHSIPGLGHPISRSLQQTPHLRGRLCSRHLVAKAGRSKSVATQPDDDDLLPPRCNPIMDKKDLTIDQLASMVKGGDLDLQPAYQRGLVWDKEMASRLVVTALESRVLPAVFLEETEDETYSVMDGKQRLASLISFYTGDPNVGGLSWEAAPTALHIADEDTCDPRWRGWTFARLPEKRQRAFKNFSVLCQIVRKSTDRDDVFAIYQDINTGSVRHSPQQSRKAAFHGPYVELLDELANNQYFKDIQGREQPKNSKKESDRELALRFCAMERNAKKFKTPMHKFLNREIKDHQGADSEKLDELRSMFNLTVETVWKIWDKEACRDITAKNKDAQKLLPALWDATMVAVWEELQVVSFQKLRKEELIDRKYEIREAYKQLLLDGKFRALLVSTSKSNVVDRIQKMHGMLRQTAPKRHDSKRGFDVKLKQQLWDNAVTANGAAGVLCGICKQVIDDVSQAEVDHIIAHSRGGSTTIDNAQLAHRSCNRSKGNREAPLQKPGVMLSRS